MNAVLYQKYTYDTAKAMQYYGEILKEYLDESKEFDSADELALAYERANVHFEASPEVEASFQNLSRLMTLAERQPIEDPEAVVGESPMPVDNELLIELVNSEPSPVVIETPIP